MESSSSYKAQFADVTYTVEVITLYKGEAGAPYREGSELSFTTKASSSLCGISMEIGDDYLLDLNRHDGSNELRAGLCGVFSDWSKVNMTALEGCASINTQALSPTQVRKYRIGPLRSSACLFSPPFYSVAVQP